MRFRSVAGECEYFLCRHWLKGFCCLVSLTGLCLEFLQALSLPCATSSFFCSGYSVSLSPAFSFKLLSFKPLLLFLFFTSFVSARLGFSQGFTMLNKSVSLFLQIWIEYLLSTFSMAHHSDQGSIIPWRCASYPPVKSKEIKCQLGFYTYTCNNVIIKTICGCLWLWDIFTGEAELWYSLKVAVQKFSKSL